MALNTMSGTASAVVQAGVIHGDVHLHPAPTPSVPSVPRQLPAAPAVFTGRTAELATLDRALAAARSEHHDDHLRPGWAGAEPPAGTAVMISAIGGAAGIGKTTLALTWAHRNLHRFPDGQLFADLQGFSPTGRPTPPADAARGFLTALGIDPAALPSNLDDLATLYRSMVAGRRILVVLDNAATIDQVAPLLPGSPTCTVLVTGRTILPSLIDRHGAHHLPLDVLGHAEARALLERRLGHRRTNAEPEATDALIELCGHHALALTITARQAAVHPAIPLAEFVTELRDLGLDALDHDTDPAASLPTVLSWSLHRLTDEQRTTFALLGIAPGPDTTLHAAAPLTGLPLPRTHRILRALREHSLLDRQPQGRYSMHDLIRAYATITAHNDLTELQRRAALDRVIDFYDDTAHTVHHVLHPHKGSRTAPPITGVCPEPIADQPTALTWLDLHHPHLLAAHRIAVTHQRHMTAFNLAAILGEAHERRGHRYGALDVWQATTRVAAYLPFYAAIRVHRYLGRTYAEHGQHQKAIEQLNQALTLAEHHHEPVRQARIQLDLQRAWELHGDDRQALKHARQALDLARNHGDPLSVASALNAVGWHAAHVGDLAAARDHCQQALTMFRQHSAPEAEGNVLDSLGFIAHRNGDHTQALNYYHQALESFRTTGDARLSADTLDRLGHVHHDLGKHDQAHTAWQEALRLFRHQDRTADAERVRQLLDNLDSASATNAHQAPIGATPP
ncbi:hypothetical protein ADK67_27655 [Saccharothrix sp. NRRL B-16348]|nr:hypothetical protein ADK67_27655 [Saccharothrix sp. NRRL B-16348]